MIENLPNVPPAILLLAREFRNCPTLDDARRCIRKLLPELRDQSRVFERELALSKSTLVKNRSTSFDVHLHGALDMFGGNGCRSLACREKTANSLVRSVGLIADRVWISDHLSEKFADFGRVTNNKLDDVAFDMFVIVQLLPLILTGVIQFRSPWTSLCKQCIAEFNERIETSSKTLLKQFRKEFKLAKQPNGEYIADTGACFDPPMHYRVIHSKGQLVPTAARFALRTIAEESRSAMWVAREASLMGGSIFSNSRIGLAALQQEDGRLGDRKSLLVMDADREFDVPWVSDLNALQIVQLREEASKALPTFREKMAHALSTSKPRDSTDTIAELRYQAAEVRAELQAKRGKSAHLMKATYGLLGLGLSVYGVANEQVVPGVAGLLPLIQLLISHQTGHEADVAKLTTRPAYVLVKAQDILTHAQH